MQAGEHSKDTAEEPRKAGTEHKAVTEPAEEPDRVGTEHKAETELAEEPDRADSKVCYVPEVPGKQAFGHLLQAFRAEGLRV